MSLVSSSFVLFFNRFKLLRVLLLFTTDLLMTKSSVSISFAVVVSLSFTASSSCAYFSLSSLPPFSVKESSLSFPRSLSPNATASDVLVLLGPKSQSSTIDPIVADELRSCFKFLVPSEPLTYDFEYRDKITGYRNLSACQRRRELGENREDKENQLIWWPPASVLELARLAVDSGGKPDAISRTLDPTIIPVPDVEGSINSKCELTRTPYGRRFINEELNSYLAFLFEIIASHAPAVGLNVSLSRYDLFHGHIFLAANSNRLGILFHAKEYPAYDEELFPYHMGYCQMGSNINYDDEMNFRNILWLAPLPSCSRVSWLEPGVLVILDAHPEGIIYKDLIPDYAQYARTLYEDDFGEVVADVNYLKVGNLKPSYQIFIC